MRVLRSSVFFLVLCSITTWAQTTQASPGQQPAAAQAPDNNQPRPEPGVEPQSQTQNQAPEARQGGDNFKLKVIPPRRTPDEKKFPAGTLDGGFRAASPQLPRLTSATTGIFGQLPALQSQSHRRQVRPGAPIRGAQFMDPEGELDRGIRINLAANTCGSIVSYNFSRSAPGEMPKLESITTCTPTNKIVPRRTQDNSAKPTGPRVIETAVPQ